MVTGGLSLTLGLPLLGTIGAHTSFWAISLYMLPLGLGLGATMQNLVLAVQNTVTQAELGAASSTIAFFRSLGGAIGVSALGAILGHRVTARVAEGLSTLGVQPSAEGAGGGIPVVSQLPAPIRRVVENAYGDAISEIFLVAAPFALIAWFAILAMREIPLRRTLDLEDTPAAEPAGQATAEAAR